jgi:hypothetical protein
VPVVYAGNGCALQLLFSIICYVLAPLLVWKTKNKWLFGALIVDFFEPRAEIAENVF